MDATTSCLALLVLVAVGGCGSDFNSGGEGAPAAATPTETAQSPDELYLSTVRQSGLVGEVSDDALLSAGREVCDALDRGIEPVEVLGEAVESDAAVGTTIMGAAVATMCREHLDAVQELADQLG